MLYYTFRGTALLVSSKESAGLLAIGVKISRRDGSYSLENVGTFRHHSGQVLKLEKAVIKS